MFGGVLIIVLLLISMYKQCLHDLPAVQKLVTCSVIIGKTALINMCQRTLELTGIFVLQNFRTVSASN